MSKHKGHTIGIDCCSNSVNTNYVVYDKSSQLCVATGCRTYHEADRLRTEYINMTRGLHRSGVEIKRGVVISLKVD